MKRFIFVVATVLSLGLSNFALAARGDKLKCPDVINFTEQKGQTFLNFMRTVVKPSLDDYATKGYEVADSDTVIEAFDNVSDKVRRKMIRAIGASDIRGATSRFRKLVDGLQGENVTLYTLPGAIERVATDLGFDISPKTGKSTIGKFDISTFLGLVSCGGAVIQFAPGNFAYNIHYGTGHEDKDDRTGRSFGANSTRNADDASDAAYLTDLEAYVRSKDADLDQFYKNILNAILKSDNTGYKDINAEGQMVVTDFLAVMVAEQDRNLMKEIKGRKLAPHWDAALLEVTLLSAFHAGQDKVKLLYTNPKDKNMYFTDTTYKQAKGCDPVDKLPSKAAGLIDYWQFSKSTDPKQCGRSGINITKNEFRALGREITKYLEEHSPEVVEKIRELMTGIRPSSNIFYDLSKFLIRGNAPESLGRQGTSLVNAWVKLLAEVRTHAQDITEQLETGIPGVDCEGLLEAE